MPTRLKLIIAYDGAPFAGWQSQTHGNTVQDHIERAIGSIGGHPVRVHGAGRTDAGVHALGQCAHVDLGDGRIPAEKWLPALNAQLPAAIRILRCRYVSNAFHARYSAKGKTYRYMVWNDAVLPPFERGRAWHVTAALNVEAITEAAREFEGRHDFAAFAANRGTPVASTVRTILRVRIRRSGPRITLQFEGDGFLYKMVRLMAGALVRVGRGATTGKEIRQRVRSHSAGIQAPRFAAPPEGLILLRVRY
jgi:tRNA pseudouridine38-40 synthase